ncbi:MAG TPA: Hsp33 family molecular chaperone HslO [Thermoanaerobaculia bacterium]
MESAPESRLQLGLAGGGAFRWAAADITAMLREVRDRLDLSPVAAAALGRSMAGAAMLLRLATKTPSRLVLEVRGDGPLGVVRVDVDQDGNLQGLVGDPRVEVPHLPNDKLAVGRAVGRGLLRVLREYSEGSSYQSQVELVSGEIGDDLAHYLVQSEQSRPAVLIGVLGRQSGVAAAGGVIVEVLPGASEERIARLEKNIAAMPGVSWLLEAGGVDNVLDTLLADLDREVLETRPLRYRCRCSWERFQRYLTLLPEADREYLSDEDGAIETDCNFCGNHYRFTRADLVPQIH